MCVGTDDCPNVWSRPSAGPKATVVGRSSPFVVAACGQFGRRERFSPVEPDHLDAMFDQSECDVLDH